MKKRKFKGTKAEIKKYLKGKGKIPKLKVPTIKLKIRK